MTELADACTSGDLLLVAFNALAPEEQEEAFARIGEARLTRLAGKEDETAQFLRSLQRVQEHVGCELSPDLYRAARAELRESGSSSARRPLWTQGHEPPSRS